MTRAFDRLVKLLYDTRSVHQFVAVERERTGVSARVSRGIESAAVQRHQRTWTDAVIDIAVYRNLDKGRGATHLRIHPAHVTGGTAEWKQLIERAVDCAQAGLEPVWNLPLPAAPARVPISDRALERDPENAIADVQERINAFGQRSASTLSIRDSIVSVDNQRVRMRTSDAFSYAFRETLLSVEVSMNFTARADLIERVRRQTRRLSDMDVQAVLKHGAAHLSDRAQAVPTPPGQYDIALVEDARTPDRVSNPMSHPSPDLAGRSFANESRYGWLSPFVAQADARSARRGMTRYRPGQSIYSVGHRADRPRIHPVNPQHRRQSDDPLTIVSDATMPYGLFSRPMGPLGAPTRRFTVIERGVAVGLAMDLREAGIRGQPANGGIGNLAIAPGSASSEKLMRPGTRPLLQVRLLDWLDVDVHSGAFVAAIGLGQVVEPGDRVGDVADAKPPVNVTGGIVRGNLFELWIDARLSSDTDVSGWYVGPRTIRFSNVEIS